MALSSVKIAKSNQVIDLTENRTRDESVKNSHRCEPHDLSEKQFCFFLFQIQILRNPAFFKGPPVVELHLSDAIERVYPHGPYLTFYQLLS